MLAFINLLHVLVNRLLLYITKVCKCILSYFAINPYKTIACCNMTLWVVFVDAESIGEVYFNLADAVW